MSIAKLTVEIDQLRDDRAKIEKDYSKANSQYVSGAVALLIGLALWIVLGWLFIGGFVALIGILATLTNYPKKNRLQKEIDEIDSQIAAKRNEIAASDE